MEGQLMNEANNLARGTLDSSFNYMNIGFTLASAIAWTQFAQLFIKNKLKVSGGGNGYGQMVMYPVLVTLVAVLVFQVSRRVNPNTKRPVVVPVVSA